MFVQYLPLSRFHKRVAGERRVANLYIVSLCNYIYQLNLRLSSNCVCVCVWCMYVCM
jgi:hypothetical protein